MKKLTVLFMAIATVAIVFNSCGKYEEGPDFSLRTKMARMTGTWEVEKMIIKILENNEVVQEEEYSPGADEKITYTLNRDGTGEATYTESYDGVSFSETIDLEWRFSDDKTELLIRVKDEEEELWSEWESSTILRLTNSELWVQSTDTEDGETVVTEIRWTKV